MLVSFLMNTDSAHSQLSQLEINAFSQGTAPQPSGTALPLATALLQVCVDWQRGGGWQPWQPRRSSCLFYHL